MSVGFYLKDKKAATSNIDCVVSYKGAKFRRSTKQSVPVKKWNNSTQRCAVNSFSAGISINKKLNELYLAAFEACNHFIEKGLIPDNRDFWNHVDILLGGKPVRNSLYFEDYLKTYIERIRQYREKSTTNKYITTLHRIQDYQDHRNRRLQFEDIDMNFYNDFQRFIYSLDLSENYFGTFIKCIKSAYREAREVDKIHDLNNVENKKFKVISETADTIYLTTEELLRIYNVQITPQLVREKLNVTDTRDENIRRKIEALDIARKKFLIGAFTALRVSDFNRLQEVNLKRDLIKIKTKKTGANVTIPIHWVIKEILESGFDLNTKMAEQNINEHIKEVGKLADITDLVEKSQNKGGKTLVTAVEKWTLITNHTARRSGATNMVKAGANPINVMKITGHTKWATFMKYIKLSDEENADLLRGSGFFDKPLLGNESGNKTE